LIQHIRNLDDDRLEPFRNVRDRDLKGRHDLFLGEGTLTVDRMLALEGVVRAVLVAERWAERYEQAASTGVDVYVVSQELMETVAGFPFHRGVLAAGRRAPFEKHALADVIPPPGAPATLLLVDDVSNVDNIGLLFRNAAAMACDGVVLSPRCSDPLYRKSLRVSLGHVLSVPWCRTTDWAVALEALKESSVTLVAAALHPEAVRLDDLEPPGRVGVLVGQEYRGISETTGRMADHWVRIPMAPGVDSLNVAAASAVVLHHLSRGHRA